MPLPNIGLPELIIILVIALLVIGPGKLPEVGTALGKGIREFRKAASDVQEATTLETPPQPTPAPSQAAPAQVAPAATAAPVATAPVATVEAAPAPPPVAATPAPEPAPVAATPAPEPAPATPGVTDQPPAGSAEPQPNVLSDAAAPNEISQPRV